MIADAENTCQVCRYEDVRYIVSGTTRVLIVSFALLHETPLLLAEVLSSRRQRDVVRRHRRWKPPRKRQVIRAVFQDDFLR